jgi:hypothetical protein
MVTRQAAVMAMPGSIRVHTIAVVPESKRWLVGWERG